VAESTHTHHGIEKPPLDGVPLDDLLRLLAVPHLGPVGARRVLEHFGSLAAARRAPARDWERLAVRGSVRVALKAERTAEAAREEQRRAEDEGVTLIAINAPGYPPSLRLLHDAPLVLYVKGALLERDAVAVGVVGARRASAYGVAQAARLAGDLGRAGFTIVSGLARGIDAAAHEAALRAGGRTLAVLGNGLDRVYPAEHESLAERLGAQGALLSELPFGTGPVARNFPARNRLIAGLSLGVLVVEASERSGALITARLAGECGKEVFAVPGDVHRPQTRGVHRLLRHGAKLVESIDDIVEELGPLAGPVRVADEAPPLEEPRALLLNERERALYDLLTPTPKDIDALTRESGMAAANVAGTLTILEMKRLAVQRPGRLYARATPARL
jgi:DNA processing protein